MIYCFDEHRSLIPKRLLIFLQIWLMLKSEVGLLPAATAEYSDSLLTYSTWHYLQHCLMQALRLESTSFKILNYITLHFCCTKERVVPILYCTTSTLYNVTNLVFSFHFSGIFWQPSKIITENIPRLECHGHNCIGSNC